MANWYGSSRSNYFKVKDEAAFRKWADELGLTVITNLNPEGTLFGVYPGDSDDGFWPSFVFGDFDDEEREVDICAELAEHLAEGEVAVLMTIGAAKLRYLIGHATAVKWTGETVEVSINDIYEKAFKVFGVKPTPGEY